MHLPLLTEKTMNESIKAALIALAVAAVTAGLEKVLTPDIPLPPKAP
jgi:hypothetical protein